MKNYLFSLMALLYSLNSIAVTYTVNSQATFDNADSNAVAGDIIEWTDGIYSDIYMDIDASDIIVRAETLGGVIFTGSSRAIIDGSNVTFTGFQYVSGNILDGTTNTVNQTILTVDGSNNIISHLNFSDYTCWKYMRIRDSSQYTNVSYCNFENRLNYADQNIFQIDASATQPGFHNIIYCSFKNFTGAPGSTSGDDGVEPIRTGASSQSLFSSKTIIEYCYFTSCNGDDEVISGKASDCIYRYNTLEGNDGEIVLRHGNRGVVYGNFFVNNEAGVRVREGTDHIIYNNYFSGLTSKSVDLQASSDPVRVENVIVAHNTFVGSQVVELGDNSDLTDPLNTTVINNIFKDCSSSGYLRSIPTDDSLNLFGNLIDDSSDILHTEDAGVVVTDSEVKAYVSEQLFANVDGYYELTSASTEAIDAAADNAVFPFPVVTDITYDNEILFDLVLNPRTPTVTLKDVGAQEYVSTGNIVTPHATESNTGPAYTLADPNIVLSNDDFISILGSDVSVYPNPITNNQINLSFNFKNTTVIEVELYTLNGKKIQSIMKETLDAGAHNLSETLDNLSTGIYLIQINAKDKSSKQKASKTEKLIKL